LVGSAGVTCVMSRPWRLSDPPVGSSSPAMMFIRVLLPQPEGPTRTRNSPSCRPIEMSCRILTGPKLFCTLTRSRDAIMYLLLRRLREHRGTGFAGPQVLPPVRGWAQRHVVRAPWGRASSQPLTEPAIRPRTKYLPDTRYT